MQFWPCSATCGHAPTRGSELPDLTAATPRVASVTTRGCSFFLLHHAWLGVRRQANTPRVAVATFKATRGLGKPSKENPKDIIGHAWYNK